MKGPVTVVFALTIQAIGVSAIADHLPLSSHQHLVGGIEERRQKRQADLSTSVLNSRCQHIIFTQECTGGLSQELVVQALKCNQSNLAEDIRHTCVTNANGDYCGGASLFLNRVLSIPMLCVSSDEGNTCTEDCRTLLIDIRDGLGCCISGTFNSSTSVLSLKDPFRYSLWSNCGVDPVDECPDNSGLSIPTGVEGDPNCDYHVAAPHTSCSRRFADPVITALSAENDCKIYANILQELCGVNKAGQLCMELITPLTARAASVDTNCGNVLTTCDLSCKSSLKDLSEETGCCFNNIFNGTLMRDALNVSADFMSNENWSQCGLESPGFCQVQFVNDTAFDSYTGSLLPKDEGITPFSDDSSTTKVASEDGVIVSSPEDVGAAEGGVGGGDDASTEFSIIDQSAILLDNGSAASVIAATIATTVVLVVIAIISVIAN